MDARLPQKLPFSKKPLGARIIISYILDYLILVALILGFFILDKVEPYHQPFSLDNYTLYYPFAAKERIPMFMALALTGGGPSLIIIFYTMIIDGLFSHHSPRSATTGRRKLMGPYRFLDRVWELNCGILGLFLSQAAAFAITSALKNATGKPRPDIIDRCLLPEDLDLPKFGLANFTMCTQTDAHMIKDGFRSFPSGHSSSAFAGLFYLTLYLAGKLHVMDSRGEVWKTCIVLTPTVGATLVAVSRIMDARHHPFDVIFGSLLGVACAVGAYRQYFPPLSEPWRKGRAYPIRTWGTISQGPPESDRVRLVGRGSEPRSDEEDPEARRDGVLAPTRKPTYRTTARDSSPEDNQFTPMQPNNPYLRRMDTDVPSNYSESSSEGQTPGGTHRGIEMQPGYGAARIRKQQTTDSLESRDHTPFPRETAYQPPT